MQLDVYKIDGSLSGEKITLSPDIFEIQPNDHAIYMVVRSIRANQHQGTHKVKPRNEVRGGGRKPFRQKKTGRARQGTSRSPLMVGGGSIFGPMPHDYVIDIPAKMRKLARKSALSYKAKGKAIMVVEDFKFDQVKTKQVVSVLKALSLHGKKTLLMTSGSDGVLFKSGRNISKLNVRPADKASTYEILDNDVLVFQKSAIGVLENTLKN